MQTGKVALIGPVAMFASEGGEAAGVLQQELNKADPTMVPAGRGTEEASRALVTEGKGELVLDPTLGNAFKLTALEDSLYEKIAKGGPAMIPLLALGVAALIVALVKWIQLARVRVATEADLQRVLREIEIGDRTRRSPTRGRFAARRATCWRPPSSMWTRRRSTSRKSCTRRCWARAPGSNAVCRSWR